MVIGTIAQELLGHAECLNPKEDVKLLVKRLDEALTMTGSQHETNNRSSKQESEEITRAVDSENKSKMVQTSRYHSKHDKTAKHNYIAAVP